MQWNRFPVVALALLLAVAFTGTSAQLFNDDQSDSSDPDVDANGQGCELCAAFSRCVNGRCVCRDGFVGNPYVLCSNPNVWYRCLSSSDPGYHTLSGENYVNHVVGSTRLVQMTTRDDFRQCDFRLYGWTTRFQGKLYFSGLSFRVDLSDSRGNQIIRRAHISTSTTDDGAYRWTVNVIEGGDQSQVNEQGFSSETETSDEIAFRTIHIPGCNVEIRRVTGNFLRVRIPCCGLRFGIRQFNPHLPQIIPGFWFEVLRQVNPTYESWQDFQTEPLCMEHTGQVKVADIIKNTGITIGRREAMTFHAIANTPFILYPDAPSGLDIFKTMLRGCPEERRNELFQLFFFFFDQPQILKCLDGSASRSTNHLIQALIHAVGFVCHGTTDSCEPLSFVMSRPECNGVLKRFPAIKAVFEQDCPEGAIHDQFKMESDKPT